MSMAVARAKKEKPQSRLRTGEGRSPRSGTIPPPEFRFRPGQSGNPGGRPKTKLISQAYQELLEELDKKKRRTIAQEIAKQIIQKALKGDLAAAKEATDRTEGKAVDQTELLIGGTVEHRHSWIDKLSKTDKKALLKLARARGSRARRN